MNKDIDLANAFPSAVRDDALVAAARFPEVERYHQRTFSVRVAGETVAIPEAVSPDPATIDIRGLSALQCNWLIAC